MPDFVVKTPNYDMMTSAADNSLQVTWLGHASVLFQVDGMNILSDPVFGKYCGATQSRPFGKKRFRDCKTDVDNLPDIHAVVISHDHYDHLDYYTVSMNVDVYRPARQILDEGSILKEVARGGRIKSK